ncbi:MULTISPECIES: thiazole synthase [unclassified Oceanobacter]|jgi:thiazole synthase|uniref:thiazole synthase n=1 Tax=unclassified Oceanobacter TaxID=2620260 RepID=UPI0026E3F078|nr:MULTISPECIES: thiazole synthase [unclassified Oceanobacter]MDO6681470.1 thiazole synthase [Oceanobacter sp. 5_MG-2023]MDP2609297.1 thiazole synthase [Oceanobacter sp. 1_MG-2023]MDP2612606.1 thiazole synthase [Oceanobacter sp. 2_MG-2023]
MIVPTVKQTVTLAEEDIAGRLWLGSSLYPSPDLMAEAITAASPGFVTVALRRQTARNIEDNGHWALLKETTSRTGARLLPNTAGCFTAREAILMATLARELFATSWIKLEVMGDDYTLQPDPFELLEAARELVSQGFKVLPYCTEDLVLCQRLLDAGCVGIMPWGAPIGSGCGLQNPEGLKRLRQRLPEAFMVIDAGLGKPSQAMQAMELGFDAVLLNTAVAQAEQPVAMASAFAAAVSGGRMAYEAGLMTERPQASPSTPLLGLPFWHQTSS